MSEVNMDDHPREPRQYYLTSNVAKTKHCGTLTTPRQCQNYYFSSQQNWQQSKEWRIPLKHSKDEQVHCFRRRHHNVLHVERFLENRRWSSALSVQYGWSVRLLSERWTKTRIVFIPVLLLHCKLRHKPQVSSVEYVWLYHQPTHIQNIERVSYSARVP